MVKVRGEENAEMNREYIIDAELLKRALGTSMRDPGLQRIFKEAPQAVKPVLKLKFAAMVFPDQISDEAFGVNLEEVTKTLGADDLRYLIGTETDAGMRAYFENLVCEHSDTGSVRPVKDDEEQGVKDQRMVDDAAKTSGGIDEADQEVHGEKVRDVVRDGVTATCGGLGKLQVVARTLWQNLLAAPIVVKVICCLLMAKGIGALYHLYNWGGLFGLPALIVNTTFTSMGVMAWEELISAVVFLIVFPYAVLKKRTWVGKVVVVTFVVTQLMCFVVMIFTLGFNARILRELLFAWENICMIAALVMLSMKSVRVWFGVNSDESGGKICLNTVRRDIVAWMRRNPLMVGVAGVLIGLLCMTLVMSSKRDCHLGSDENRQVLDRTAKYRQAKVWYQKQLDYNGLTESWFSYKRDTKSGDSYWLDLSADGGGSVEISLENGEWFKWPKSMPKGFAKDLIDARITIFSYEDSDAGVRSATWRSGKKYME